MSPWRSMLNTELARREMRGRVLDLGGDRRSDYLALLQIQGTLEVVNLMPEAKPDHTFDLEERFPLPDGAYDGVMGINILEHIYNYAQFLSECRRILKNGGRLLIAVPFIIQIHPSPHDHFRYTGETLERLLKEAGFTDIRVVAVGKGPFTAAAQLAHNALSKVPLLSPLHAMCSAMLDALLTSVDRKGTFSASRYALGYIVTATR